MSLSSPILVNDNEAVRWCKLQRAFRAIADNAGISYTMSGLLTDIAINDNIGVRWAKLGAWANLIAANISGGGGSSVQAGVEDLAQNDVSKAIVFPTAFATAPAVVPAIIAPDGTGFVISASPDETTRTTAGITILFGAAIPAAGYKLTWVAQEESV